MLNIKELSDILADARTSSDDARTTLIVIALVEQRMVLERIAERLDVQYMAFPEIESRLDRIALALEERNNAFKGILDERQGPAGNPG